MQRIKRNEQEILLSQYRKDAELLIEYNANNSLYTDPLFEIKKLYNEINRLAKLCYLEEDILDQVSKLQYELSYYITPLASSYSSKQLENRVLLAA